MNSRDIKDAFRFASPQVRYIAVKSVGQLNHLAIRYAPCQLFTLEAPAQLNRALAASRPDLPKRRRGRARVTKAKERMVQEVQRHRQQVQAQPLGDAYFLVETHIKLKVRSVAEVNE